MFATPQDENGQNPHTTTVSITPDPAQAIYDAAPWLKDEKAYLRHLERANAHKHETHDDDEDNDAISGSLQWVRNSGDTASTAKSELEFARSPRRDAFGEEGRRSSPVDRECCSLAHPLYSRPCCSVRRLTRQSVGNAR